MIDREARRQTATAIRSFLGDQIKSWQFSDTLADIAGQTDDHTVHVIEKDLWFFYDDIKDHKIVVTKPVWDWIHRLVLILESDGEIEALETRRRSPRRIIAACALAVFVILAANVGSGLQFLALLAAFGLVSQVLSVWKSRAEPSPYSLDLALDPFSSITELLKARRRVPRFIKMPYPMRLTKRKIRPLLDIIDIPMPMTTCFLSTTMRLLFSPVYLLFQCRREIDIRTSVKIPQ
ncbi:MAG: hypothetical protein ACYSWO_07155 [Planctomycetota bacterium]|jgi:hypothetical protein